MNKVLSIIWALMFIAAAIALGWRGLRLPIGLPGVLVGPLVLGFWTHQLDERNKAHSTQCLP